MKKFAIAMMVLSLGLFSFIGCGGEEAPKKKTDKPAVSGTEDKAGSEKKDDHKDGDHKDGDHKDDDHKDDAKKEGKK